MSKYRFDPLALLDHKPVQPAAERPSKPKETAPPVGTGPRWGQFDDAIEEFKRQEPAPRNAPEREPPTINPLYQAAVSAAFTAAGFADARAKENVLTFRQWLTHGRCVNKGQKAVRVEIQVPRGRPAKMVPKSVFLFHLSQTRALAEAAAKQPTPTAEPEGAQAIGPISLIPASTPPAPTRPLPTWKRSFGRFHAPHALAPR